MGADAAATDGEAGAWSSVVPLQPVPHDRGRHQRHPAQRDRRAPPRPAPRPRTRAADRAIRAIDAPTSGRSHVIRAARSRSARRRRRRHDAAVETRAEPRPSACRPSRCTPGWSTCRTTCAASAPGSSTCAPSSRGSSRSNTCSPSCSRPALTRRAAGAQVADASRTRRSVAALRRGRHGRAQAALRRRAASATPAPAIDAQADAHRPRDVRGRVGRLQPDAPRRGRGAGGRAAVGVRARHVQRRPARDRGHQLRRHRQPHVVPGAVHEADLAGRDAEHERRGHREAAGNEIVLECALVNENGEAKIQGEAVAVLPATADDGRAALRHPDARHRDAAVLGRLQGGPVPPAALQRVRRGPLLPAAVLPEVLERRRRVEAGVGRGHALHVLDRAPERPAAVQRAGARTSPRSSSSKRARA